MYFMEWKHSAYILVVIVCQQEGSGNRAQLLHTQTMELLQELEHREYISGWRHDIETFLPLLAFVRRIH